VNTVAERIYNTSAFAPQHGHLTSTAATIQHADVFARHERQFTGFSLSEPKPRQITVFLQIDDETVALNYPDFGTGLPTWATPVLRSLSERWGVRPGWDGYDAKPTDLKHVVRLLNYLSAFMQDGATPPTITPLSDGGLQAEWHRQNRDLEIVVPADEPARYYYYNAATDEEEERDLESNSARVQELIEQF
jgi:hypothetical protein